MIVKYRERIFLDKYRCMDKVTTVELYKPWRAGSLLYGYIDRFNIVSIAVEDILEVKQWKVSEQRYKKGGLMHVYIMLYITISICSNCGSYENN